MKKMITLAFMMVFSVNLGMAMDFDRGTGIKSLLENYQSQDIPEVKAPPAYSIGSVQNSLNKAYQRLYRMGLNGMNIHVALADLYVQIQLSRVPFDAAMALALNEYIWNGYVLADAEEVVSYDRDFSSDNELEKAALEYIRSFLIKEGITVMMLDFESQYGWDMRKSWGFEIGHFTGGVAFYIFVDRDTGATNFYTQD